ncbi:hypothetical protein CHH55_23335 [Niallia circulans]|uniref:hypothetical protein n=1 Tax=Niallia circulans TaxID=1397 RepID=UPI000BA61230|nr:hypothetical protein [Niallia circulans]PAD85466.1 hypothetical protein CHH55_23335 [Niallia circulans]
MNRKFMAEFGLNSYSSYVTICYPNDLNTIEIGPRYHIYMINKIPKLNFVDKSIIVKKNYFSVDVRIKSDAIDKIETIKSVIHPFIDHRFFDFSFDKPFKSLIIKDDENGGAGFRVLPFYLEHGGHIDSEIVYIGRSYGENGERDAFTRLKSHSTLQKIQSDHLFESPKSDIAITLWEFTPQLLTGFDGRAKKFQMNSVENELHMAEILNDPPLHISKQLINITEAALIHYFKPEYNNLLKNNFPNKKHKDYKLYYDLDFNAINVELSPDSINTKIYSKTREYNVFRSIRYNLNSEKNRKSMFDIFSKN